MASAKSVFEQVTTAETSPKLSKKTSKWDKPKPVPPPPVNSDPDNPELSTESELPPPAYTKNMLAKFQSLQSEGELSKDSELHSCKPKKVWIDDELSSPVEDAADDTNEVDAGEQAADCMMAGNNPKEVERYDTELVVCQGDVTDKSNEEECLISFDDEADVGGPAADKKHEDHNEDDNPSDFPSHDLADVPPADHHESITADV